MLSQLSSDLANLGRATLVSYRPGATTEAVAADVGTLMPVEGAADVQVLRPRERDASPPNIYSGSYGTGEFPLHTDLAHWFLPPRYMLLRCIIGSEEVPTRVLDGRRLIDAIGASTLSRTLVQPRRPIHGQRPLLRLLEKSNSDRLLLRWDSLFTVPATHASKSVFVKVNTFLNSSAPEEIVLANLGDTLIIDNWRMLHGRAPVPASAKTRQIERAYIGALHEGE